MILRRVQDERPGLAGRDCHVAGLLAMIGVLRQAQDERGPRAARLPRRYVLRNDSSVRSFGGRIMNFTCVASAHFGTQKARLSWISDGLKSFRTLDSRQRGKDGVRGYAPSVSNPFGHWIPASAGKTSAIESRCDCSTGNIPSVDIRQRVRLHWLKTQAENLPVEIACEAYKDA